MGKIVDFTNKRAEKEIEDFNLSVETASELVDSMGDAFQDMLEAYGYVELDDKLAQDYFIFLESVRSLAYRYIGIEHPFQNVAEKMVDVYWNEEQEAWAVDWNEKIVDKETDV